MNFKYIFTTVIFACFLMTSHVEAQDDPKWTELDKSPFDMAYYPAQAAWRNYLSGDDRTMSPKMRITYSRPAKKDRAIFGSLVPYGAEWRLGANEATEITMYQAVEIDGKRIPRGTYSVFATPQQDHWMISFSSERSLWGSENRDKSKDVASVKVMTEELPEVQENLAMAFQRINDESANLVIEWDKTRVTLPIGFNPITFEDMDASPMDRVHYPKNSAFLNYMKPEEKDALAPKVKVTYSRPQKKERKVFGELLKYGNVWRIGANESTEVSFYGNVKVGGKELRSGTYNMYATVNEASWDIIFNTDRPAWGPPNRDESKDVLTVTVPIEMNSEDLEVLNIKFDEISANEAHMIIAWEKTMVRIPITFE